jgi:hypothetical protein
VEAVAAEEVVVAVAVEAAAEDEAKFCPSDKMPPAS